MIVGRCSTRVKWKTGVGVGRGTYRPPFKRCAGPSLQSAPTSRPSQWRACWTEGREPLPSHKVRPIRADQASPPKTRAGSAATHRGRLPVLRPWDERGGVLRVLFGVLREAVCHRDVGRLVASDVKQSI